MSDIIKIITLADLHPKSKIDMLSQLATALSRQISTCEAILKELIGEEDDKS